MAKNKKKIGKIMTVPVAKATAPLAVENIIGALSSLQNSEGWALMVKILNDNIAYLEKGIIDKIDPLTKETLDEKDIELLRIKRALNIELRETPKNYSQVVMDSGEVPENFDPYYQSNDEILKDKRKAEK